jgi:hypothetical protein
MTLKIGIFIIFTVLSLITAFVIYNRIQWSKDIKKLQKRMADFHSNMDVVKEKVQKTDLGVPIKELQVKSVQEKCAHSCNHSEKKGGVRHPYQNKRKKSRQSNFTQ